MRLGTARLAFEQPRKDYLLLVGYAVFIVSYSASNLSSPVPLLGDKHSRNL